MTVSSNRNSARLWTAGIAAFVIGAGSILAGVGLAQDTKKPDSKPDQPPAKTEKKPEFDPKDVRVGPPPELAALREAVEQAARKGENVDEIRKKLEALETALAGKPWVKPEAPKEPQGRDLPQQIDPLIRPRIPRQQLPQPELEQLQKAQQMMLEGLLAEAAGDKEKAQKLLAEARDLMMKGLGGDLGIQGIPGVLDFGFAAPAASKPRLGVQIEPLFEDQGKEFKVPADRGIRIVEVVPGSVADKAGFKAGDIVTEFAGKPVANDAAAFIQAIREAKAGEKFNFTVIRDGKEKKIEGVVLPPQAKALPVPAPLPKFDIPALPGLGRALPVPPEGAGSARVSIRRQGNEFTIDAEEGGAKFLIEGAIENGNRVTHRIVVNDGKEKFESESVKQLPEKYRDQVQKFLGNVKVVD